MNRELFWLAISAGFFAIFLSFFIYNIFTVDVEVEQIVEHQPQITFEDEIIMEGHSPDEEYSRDMRDELIRAYEMELHELRDLIEDSRNALMRYYEDTLYIFDVDTMYVPEMIYDTIYVYEVDTVYVKRFDIDEFFSIFDRLFAGLETIISFMISMFAFYKFRQSYREREQKEQKENEEDNLA